MDKHEVFNEAGVLYVESKEPVPGFKEFRYRWTHVKSGATGEKTVYLPRASNKDNGDRLLAHWNSVHPETWAYEEID